MNCIKLRKLMSDKVDFLLPEKEERQFDIHLERCYKCRNDTEVLLNVRPFLKAVYPDIKAPSGFALSVMKEARLLDAQVPFALPVWFGRTLRPVAAIALSAALLFGLFAHDRIDLNVIPVEEGQVHENYNEANDPVILAEPDANEDNQFVRADPAEPSDEPKMEDVPQQTQETEEPSAGQGLPADFDVPNVLEVFAEAIPEQDRPLAFETVAVSSPSPVASNGNIKAVDDFAEPITTGQPDEKIATVAFNEADIPEPSVFVRRRRVIESESVRLSVQRADKALSQIEERAEFFGVKSDMKVTDIKDDGTIVVMKSFSMPSGLADTFVTHLAAFGSIAERDSRKFDVTAEYSQMLDEHSELINEVLKSGNKAQELRVLVNDLIFFDQRSKPGMKNVVIWLEDGVDF